MKKAKLILCLGLVLAMSCTSIPAFAASISEKDEDAKAKARIAQIESEIRSAELTIQEKYDNVAVTNEMNQLNSSDQEENTTKETTKVTNKKIEAEKQAAEDSILEKYGFVTCESNTADNISQLKSASSSITFTESNITYDSASGSYRYTVDWNFQQQDSLYDTYDIVSVGQTNSSQYNILSSYAKTYTNYGNESCYVDNSGNSTPAKSAYKDCITKRFENSKGVAFNLKDGPIPNVCMPVASGKITVYVKVKSGVAGKPDNKLITSYEHNYKVYTLDGQAKISGASIDSASGVLSVTYTKVNKNWMRSSGGKFV